MEPTQTTRDIWLRRRSFFGSAALTVAVVQFGVTGIAQAQTGGSPTASPWSAQHTSFGALKQVDAGLLSIGYAEAGPADGPAVILLHGWPYDIYSFVDVAPLLATKGYRVVIPYLRGYGTTSFLSSTTMRNAQQSAVGLDIIALMDALKIQKVTAAGFDWGARGRHGGTVAGTLQGDRFRQRLSDQQPCGQPDTVAAPGCCRILVSVLFRH
jgi:alpha/beta hydrolase fold